MPQRQVRINDRDFTLDESPVPTLVQSSDRYVAYSPRPGVLLLRAPWIVRLIGGVCVAFGLLLVAMGLLTVRQGVEDGFILVFVAALPLGFGLWIRGTCFRFSRESGTCRVYRQTRPLAMILAVQVIDGGWLGPRRPFHAGEARVVRRFIFQVNLILDQATEPRLFLYSYHDLADVLRTAQHLAEFLGVPMLSSEKVSHREKQDAAAKAIEHS